LESRVVAVISGTVEHFLHITVLVETNPSKFIRGPLKKTITVHKDAMLDAARVKAFNFFSFIKKHHCPSSQDV
jgi:hypothetical protein